MTSRAAECKKYRSYAAVFCAEVEKRINRPCFVDRVNGLAVGISFKSGTNLCCTSYASLPFEELDKFMALSELERIRVSNVFASNWLRQNHFLMGALLGDREVLEDSFNHSVTV